MTHKKEKLIHPLLAIIYVFKQSIQYLYRPIRYFIAGNLDMLYIFGLIEFLYEIKEKKWKYCLIFLLVFSLYALLQCLCLSHINILKVFINVCKIFVCYLVMIYTMKNIKRIKYEKFCKYVNILLVILLIAAILLPNSVLWRHNDIVNVFDLTRLQLLYLEPSELGVHIALLIIISYGFCLSCGTKKTYCINILIGIIILALSKSLGAIATLCFAVAIMSLLFLKKTDKIKRVYKILCVILVPAIITLFIVLNPNNTLILRVQKVLEGKDASINYRITHATNATFQVLKDTGCLGVGFGNMKQQYNIDKYRIYGIDEAGITNSYFNSIAEFGGLAIITIVCLILYMFCCCYKSKSYIKYGLFCFVVIFQLAGGYLTAPIFWVAYGIILSDYKIEANTNQFN